MSKKVSARAPLIWRVVVASVVIFLVAPSAVILPNAAEFSDPISYLAIFAGIGIAVCAVINLVIAAVPKSLANLVTAILLAYAISLFIIDIIAPIDIGPIDQPNVEFQLDLIRSISQIALVVGLTFFILRFERSVTIAPLQIISLVLIVTTLAQLLFLDQSKPKRELVFSLGHEGQQNPDNPLIVHIVYDAFYGPWLPWALNELSLGTDEFQGFTHYNQHFSNYVYTKVSYPSFMSGSLYGDSQTIANWVESAEHSSIVTDLNEIGYFTAYFGLRSRYGFSEADYEQTEEFREYDAKTDNIGYAADFWLLRVAPVIVRPFLFQNALGPVSRAFGDSDFRSFASYQNYQFILDELRDTDLGSGQYIHIYSYPPHWPYQLDRDGNFVGVKSGKYEEQILLAVNMMRDLVSLLKDKGVYDDAMIIFQSDHGNGTPATSRFAGRDLMDTIKISPSQSAQIESVDPSAVDGRTLEARLSGLLLLHFPASCGDINFPMRTVNQLTQLLDLREFIRNVVSGRSCQYPVRDTIQVQHGIVIQKIDGKDISVGPNFSEGQIQVYQVDGRLGWADAGKEPFKF